MGFFLHKEAADCQTTNICSLHPLLSLSFPPLSPFHHAFTMKLILPSFILLAASLASVSEAIKISGGREIADAQAPKQFPSFCDRYRQACIQVVLDGTTSVGDRQIIYKCRKNKNHTTYSFGCKNGKGKDFTKKALRRISDTGLSSTVASTFSTTTTATTSTATTPWPRTRCCACRPGRS